MATPHSDPTATPPKWKPAPVTDVTPEMIEMGAAVINSNLSEDYPYGHPFAKEIAVEVYRAMRVGALTKAVPAPADTQK